MAIKKTIEIDVNTGDATQELNKLESSFKDVDAQAEKTDSQLQKVGDNGGAIAVLDSLTGGLATRVRDAAEASKLFNVSLKGMRTALIATGIGALVVALGVVVAYWDDIVDLVTQANAKLENQLTLVNSIQTVLDAELATLNKQIELNTLQGKANEELEKQKVAILERLREQNEAEIKLLENQLDRLRATSLEAGFWNTIKSNIAFAIFGTKALASEASNLAAQRLAEINDIAAAIETAKLKEIDLAIQLFNANATGSVDGDGRTKGQASGVGGLTPEGIAQLDSEKALQDASLQQTDEFLRQQADLREQAAQDELARAAALEQTKQNLASNTLFIIANLSEEGSKLAKGAAAAEATVNTYKAGVAAYAAGSSVGGPAGVVLGPLSAALAVGAGLLNVRNILKTPPKVTGVGGRGIAPSAPPAPSFNLVAGTENNQLSTDIQGINQEPSRAYVVSSDVTSGQELDRNIIQESTI